MKIEIINDDVPPNAMGGTERMMEGLRKHVNPELLSNFQIIPTRLAKFEEHKKKILWVHETPFDPQTHHLADPASRKRFDGIVMVSNWQAEMFGLTMNIPFSEMHVLQNAIEPIAPHEKTDKVRLIYHSQINRGLEILVPVFEHLCDHFDIELDVFSSFKLYGWESRDKEFEGLINRCKDHPKINYHGTVPNDEIRTALKSADIFAYPCIYRETSCIAAIEAMASGCLVVHPNLAALPETAANWSWMYGYHDDRNAHANIFAGNLGAAIKSVKDMKEQHVLMADYFNHFYSWERRAIQWESYLKGLLK